MPPTPQELQKLVTDWAAQTVAYAMSVRAMQVEKPIDEHSPARATAANREAHAIVQDLWLKAFNAARTQPPDFLDLHMPFVRNVLDWTHSHVYED